MPLIDSLPVVGGVVSSLINSSSNVKLSREQREFDYRMWKLNNEYNTPTKQVQRLRDAGVNPALALTNGVMDSGVSSSSAGGQSAPTVDFSPIANGVRSSVELYNQRRLNEAQIQNLNEQSTNQAIKNRYENQRQIIELDKMLSEQKLSDSQREYYTTERDRLIEENKWIDKRNSSQIHKTMMDAFQAQESGRYQRTMNQYQQIVNQYAHGQQKQILSNLQAQYSEIMSAALNNNKSAAEHAVSAALKGVEKDTAMKIQKHVVNKAFEESSMIRDSNERAWLEEIHKSTGRAGEYLPSAGRSYFSEKGYNRFVKQHRLR